MFRQWLLLKNIERGGGDPSRRQCIRKRFFVYESTTRENDDVSRRFHQREFLCPKERQCSSLRVGKDANNVRLGNSASSVECEACAGSSKPCPRRLNTRICVPQGARSSVSRTAIPP